MNFHALQKRISRAAARYGMLFACFLVEHLPFSMVKGLLTVLLSLAFRLTFRLKRIARESLRIAFGREKSEEQIEQIIHDCFKTIRKGSIELLYFSRFPERVGTLFAIEGKEHLDAALKKGKGAIMATAHFGNFPLMMLQMARSGYTVNVIMRRARDEKLADVILKMMNREKVHTIYTQPRRNCVLESLRVLRNNELLFILMDQHFGSQGGVLVDFFGQKAATAPGAIVIANRTGAPVLPIFNVRQEGHQQKIFIEPEMPLQRCGSDEESIRVNV
ncbi:MAG: lysophospholipid acyltransferase family protein, partial [Candidatus Omnitrophota bacterium]